MPARGVQRLFSASPAGGVEFGARAARVSHRGGASAVELIEDFAPAFPVALASPSLPRLVPLLNASVRARMSAEKDVKLSVYDDKEDSVNTSLLERTTGPAKDSLPTSIPDKAASLTSAEGVKKIWPGTYNAPSARCRCRRPCSFQVSIAPPLRNVSPRGLACNGFCYLRWLVQTGFTRTSEASAVPSSILVAARRAGRETEQLHPAYRSRSVGADALSTGSHDAEWAYYMCTGSHVLSRRDEVDRGLQMHFIGGTPGLTEISLFTGYIIAIWIALSSSVILQNAWILRTLQVRQILLFRRAVPNRQLLVLLPRTTSR